MANYKYAALSTFEHGGITYNRGDLFNGTFTEEQGNFPLRSDAGLFALIEVPDTEDPSLVEFEEGNRQARDDQDDLLYVQVPVVDGQGNPPGHSQWTPTYTDGDPIMEDYIALVRTSDNDAIVAKIIAAKTDRKNELKNQCDGILNAVIANYPPTVTKYFAAKSALVADWNALDDTEKDAEITNTLNSKFRYVINEATAEKGSAATRADVNTKFTSIAAKAQAWELFAGACEGTMKRAENTINALSEVAGDYDATIASISAVVTWPSLV